MPSVAPRSKADSGTDLQVRHQLEVPCFLHSVPMVKRLHASDFDPRALSRRRGHTVSVCLPAHDEAMTVGVIVEAVREELMERHPLVDELIVVDDGSTDETASIASRAGAKVVAVDEVLPDLPRGSGKGNALWKSLHVSSGEIVCWIDADIRNFSPHFVTGLVGPLLTDEAIAFTKGFYRRPIHGSPTGGGRVTELLVRPMLSQLFPELTTVVQPLAGEYAGRRDVLETIPFVEGWGVEIGMLIDVARAAGLDALAQVDLGVREHRNRPLDELGPQALAVLVTVLRRAGLTSNADALAALRRFDDDLREEVVAVETRERPPIAGLAAYTTRSGRELSA